MSSRRGFLKHSGTIALGSLALSRGGLSSLMAAGNHPIGLQLFTLFNVIDTDTPAVLKRVASIGYREIESAFSHKPAYYGYGPREFAAVARDAGLHWISHHVAGAPFKRPAGAKPRLGPDGKPIHFPAQKNLRDNAQEVIDEAAEGGLSYLVCASTPVSTLDEIHQSCQTLNQAAALAKKAGITMCYHNHDMEFHPVEGQLPYDLLLKNTDPSLLKMELDLAWATKGGADPVKLFRENPGRFPLWHVKDISADFKTLEPAGQGIVNFKRIFAQASTAGMKHFFVEHDMPADPFASITISYQYLRSISV
ncbi:MAG TPA: sugar phosphate isomerase/epimerase [Chitinophagaceae bacterium]|nr:sugar phosphate isomerase/epimerase [Chitinophagaceae bacterium]